MRERTRHRQRSRTQPRCLSISTTFCRLSSVSLRLIGRHRTTTRTHSSFLPDIFAHGRAAVHGRALFRRWVLNADLRACHMVRYLHGRCELPRRRRRDLGRDSTMGNYLGKTDLDLCADVNGAPLTRTPPRRSWGRGPSPPGWRRIQARRLTCLLLRAVQRRRVESLVLVALSSSPVHRALVLVSGTNIAVLLCC